MQQDWFRRVSCFTGYRNTKSASIQISPALRLFSRRTRSLQPMTAALLQPSVSDEDVTHTKLHRRIQQQAKYYNRSARELQTWKPGNAMWVELWRTGRKEWQKCVVKIRIDKISYEVELPQGLFPRNRVHLPKSNEAPIKAEDENDVIEAREQSCTQTRKQTREQTPPDRRVEIFDQPYDPPPTVPGTLKSPSPTQAPRRSTRIHQLPKRLQDYVFT